MKSIRLDTRVTFYSPVEGERTATGGSRNGWEEEFKAWAGVIWPKGGETLMGSRMQGRRPAILVLRKRAVLLSVKGDWSVRFQGLEYEVKELPKRQQDGMFMEMMVEAKS